MLFGGVFSKLVDKPILFIDGVHPTQGTKLAYGWMPKGQKTVVETTGSRTRLNIMGVCDEH